MCHECWWKHWPISFFLSPQINTNCDTVFWTVVRLRENKFVSKEKQQFTSLTSYGAFFIYDLQNPSSNCTALNKDVWVFTHCKLEKLRSLSCSSLHEPFSEYMTQAAIFIVVYVGVLMFSKPILVKFTQSGIKIQCPCTIRYLSFKGNVFYKPGSRSANLYLGLFVRLPYTYTHKF